MSSLVSTTNDHLASYNKYPVLWSQFKRLSDASEAIAGLIYKNRLKELYLYNGRFASTERLANLAKDERLKLWFVEYGNVPFHFTLQDYPIHDFRQKSLKALAAFESKIYLPGSLALDNFSLYQMSMLKKNRFSGKHKADLVFDVVIILSSPHELLCLEGFEESSNIPRYCVGVLNLLDSKNKCVIKMHPNFLFDPSCEILYNSLVSIANDASCYAHVLHPSSNISAIDLISKCSKVFIPTSSLAIVAEVMDKSPIIHHESFFYSIIESARLRSSSLVEKKRNLSFLYAYTFLVDQEPYHPFWIILHKILIAIDAAIVRKRDLALKV